jgi:hypothetical protein
VEVVEEQDKTVFRDLLPNMLVVVDVTDVRKVAVLVVAMTAVVDLTVVSTLAVALTQPIALLKVVLLDKVVLVD